MKNFWIAACICSIGILIGVAAFAGVSYIENQKAIDAFQEILIDSDTALRTENNTANGTENNIKTAVIEGTGNNTKAETADKLESQKETIANGTKNSIESVTDKSEDDNETTKESENHLQETPENETEKKVDPLIISVAQKEEEEEIRLLFGGDVYLSDTFLGAYDTKGIRGILDEEVLGLMTGADAAMVNQEFAFSERGTAMEDKQYTFRVPPSRVKIFQEMGIDIVSLANNHALDFGKEALEDSFDTLDQAGILYAGAGRNLSRAKEMQTITVNGKVIGVLAASRVIPVVEWNAGSSSTGMFTTYSPELLCRTIEENRDFCDYLVVFVHWGVEKNNYPEDYQFQMGKQYIDAGADLVIGCHPHVMQGIEYYQGKPIVYSLGNYIFNLRAASTGLLQIVIGGDGEVRAELIPVRTDSLPFRLLTGEEKEEFYRYIESISFQISIDEYGIIRYNKE